MNLSTVRVHAAASDVSSLGPGPAHVLWVQGCPLACPGCMSPESWASGGGAAADVADVAAWLRGDGARYLTLSGGEPLVQAAPLTRLLELTGPELIVTVYTGFELDELPGLPEAAAGLLRRADLLIAGRYLQQRHAPKLWRGSDNQVLVDLSGRVELPPDATAGVEVRLTRAGLETIGVPPAPGFRSRLQRELRARGLRLAPADSVEFPFPVRRPEDLA